MWRISLAIAPEGDRKKKKKKKAEKFTPQKDLTSATNMEIFSVTDQL